MVVEEVDYLCTGGDGAFEALLYSLFELPYEADSPFVLIGMFAVARVLCWTLRRAIVSQG